MDVSRLLKFTTKDQEIQYWKDIADQMYKRMKHSEQELQEYQVHSQMLERELETSFNQSDRRNRELLQTNYKLTASNEELKSRLNEQIRALGNVQTELQGLQAYNEELLKTVRKLEQKNDDLERFNREKTVSEEELESQFNMTLEKLAFLETEVDEIDGLKCTVQRLQDENKDLKRQAQLNERNAIDLDDRGDGNGHLEDMSCLPCPGGEKNDDRINGPATDEATRRESPAGHSDLLKYMREMEQTIESLKQSQSATNALMTKVAMLENAMLEKKKKKKNVLAKEVSAGVAGCGGGCGGDGCGCGCGGGGGGGGSGARGKDRTDRASTHDACQEAEVRLRRLKDKNGERNPRSRSDFSREEIQRNSTSSRLSRQIENRVKKVKEEEKRQQNLVWFLKRWRHSQLSWLRKRE